MRFTDFEKMIGVYLHDDVSIRMGIIYSQVRRNEIIDKLLSEYITNMRLVEHFISSDIDCWDNFI